MKTSAALVIALLLAACAPQPDPRLDAVIDRQAINQLVAGDYPRALDAHDWDTYVSYFAEDGELSLGPQMAKGHAEMKQLLEGLGDERINHIISNLSYRIDGDTATGGAYWEDIGFVEGAPGVVVAGHYDDALRKVDGEWKFTKRSIVIDFMAPSAE
jgi:ketosteroid isomerase-like protein